MRVKYSFFPHPVQHPRGWSLSQALLDGLCYICNWTLLLRSLRNDNHTLPTIQTRRTSHSNPSPFRFIVKQNTFTTERCASKTARSGHITLLPVTSLLHGRHTEIRTIAKPNTLPTSANSSKNSWIYWHITWSVLQRSRSHTRLYVRTHTHVYHTPEFTVHGS
jgi:hypothetical protein